jgi:hypothetical protein
MSHWAFERDRLGQMGDLTQDEGRVYSKFPRQANLGSCGSPFTGTDANSLETSDYYDL